MHHSTIWCNVLFLHASCQTEPLKVNQRKLSLYYNTCRSILHPVALPNFWFVVSSFWNNSKSVNFLFLKTYLLVNLILIYNTYLMMFIDPLAMKWCTGQQGSLCRLIEFWVETEESPFWKQNVDGTPQYTKYMCVSNPYNIYGYCPPIHIWIPKHSTAVKLWTIKLTMQEYLHIGLNFTAKSKQT